MMNCVAMAGALALGLAGCGDGAGLFQPKSPQKSATAEATSAGSRPQARGDGAVTAAPKPPANARTAAQFDTTSAEEKKAAAAKPADAGGETLLGKTVASLGDPSRSGFWLETPLVKAAQKGRVEYNGKSAQVDLIPIDGPSSGGSRLSLPAMQLIGAPLTDLPTIQVFAGS